MVEGEEILCAEIETEFLDKNLSGKILRKGVAYCEVLYSQVSKIVQILGLRSEVVASGVAWKT